MTGKTDKNTDTVNNEQTPLNHHTIHSHLEQESNALLQDVSEALQDPDKDATPQDTLRHRLILWSRRFKLWSPYIPTLFMSLIEYYTVGSVRKTWPVGFHVVLRLFKEFNKRNITGDVTAIQRLTANTVLPISPKTSLQPIVIPRNQHVVEFMQQNIQPLMKQEYPKQAHYTGLDHGDQVEIDPLGFAGPGIDAEWVVHEKAQEAQRVVYMLHGGAYCIGSIRIYRPMAERLSKHSISRVLVMNYRLAPQNPFPCALIDAVSGYRYLLDQGIPPNKIVLQGDSAGGGLCMSLLLVLREMKWPMPAGCIGLSPWVDLAHSFPSFDFSGKTDFLPSKSLDPELVDKGKMHYYAPNEMLKNPFVSPIYADTLRGFPPLLIQVGEVERLRDECILFAIRAAVDVFSTSHSTDLAYTPVELEIYQDQVHVFQMFLFLPSARKAMQNIYKFIQRVTEKGAPIQSHKSFIDMQGKTVKCVSFDDSPLIQQEEENKAKL